MLPSQRISRRCDKSLMKKHRTIFCMHTNVTTSKIKCDLEAVFVALVFAQMQSVAVSSRDARSSGDLRQEGKGEPPALGGVVKIRSKEIGGALLFFELRIYRGVSAFDAGEPVGQETVGNADRVLEL